MQTLGDIIKSNLIIRNLTIHSFDLDNIIRTIDLQTLELISSKSFVKQGTIINRLEGLECILNNINFLTGKKYNNIENMKPRIRHVLIAYYILAGQVFSDGNHRVTIEYLKSHNFRNEQIEKIIYEIDMNRRNIVSWENIHDYIQHSIDILS
jgi:hypothetical protein